MRRRLAVRGGLLASSFLAAALLGVAPAAANPLTPASPQARAISDLFWLTLGLALVVMVTVEFLIVYTSLRFRRSPGLVRGEPAQIHGNTRLEIMWSIVPAAILISLFILGVRTLAQVGTIPTSDARTIQVVGRQFLWEFTYPDENVKVINDLHVPVGQPVVLEITSQDVIHSFWVPDLMGKMDANPGITNRISFTAERAGVYRGVCAELCGIGHSQMLFQVTAEEPSDFEAWLQQGGQAAAAASPVPGGGGGGASDAELAQKGQQLAQQFGCLACHSTTGQTLVGPTWKGLAGSKVDLTNGQSVTADDDYLKESILQPDAKIVRGFQPGIMTGVVQSVESQIQQGDNLDALVAYIKSLK